MSILSKYIIKKIAKQNIIFVLAVKVFVLILGAYGLTNMWQAVFADVGHIDALKAHLTDVQTRVRQDIHLQTGGADTLCVGKGLHIDGKYCVFFLLHQLAKKSMIA